MSKRYTWMLVLGVILMLIVCPVKADEPASIEEIISYARTGMTDRVLPSNYNANHQVNADALKTGTSVQITKAQLKCYKDDTKQTLEATVPIRVGNDS